MSPGIVTFFICLSLERLCAGCFPCQEGISVVGLSQNIVLKAHLPFKKMKWRKGPSGQAQTSELHVKENKALARVCVER